MSYIVNSNFIQIQHLLKLNYVMADGYLLDKNSNTTLVKVKSW